MSKDQKKKLKLHFKRFEFKYVFPADIIEGLLPQLLKHMEFDPYASSNSDGSYQVNSVYYDSVGFGAYYEKISGLRSRKKLRIRYYDDSLRDDSRVFLEIKRKYDSIVVKDRVEMTLSQCLELMENNGGISFSLGHDQDTIEEFLWTKIYNSMMPQVQVSYSRKPLFSKIDPSFRVTLDYNLKARIAKSLNDFGEPISVYNDLAVLEVKFNNLLPSWFQHIICQYNFENQSFSKYSLCLEECHPSLKGDNDWVLNEPVNKLVNIIK